MHQFLPLAHTKFCLTVSGLRFCLYLDKFYEKKNNPKKVYNKSFGLEMHRLAASQFMVANFLNFEDSSQPKL